MHAEPLIGRHEIAHPELGNIPVTTTSTVPVVDPSRRRDPRVERTALLKLVMLDAAEVLDDLEVPPVNRLEALKGERVGQHSIRIHQQWRICFVWTPVGPEDVEIVDHH